MTATRPDNVLMRSLSFIPLGYRRNSQRVELRQIEAVMLDEQVAESPTIGELKRRYIVATAKCNITIHDGYPPGWGHDAHHDDLFERWVWMCRRHVVAHREVDRIVRFFA